LRDQAKRTNGIGGFRHYQFGHEPELDSGHCSRELHDQHLLGIAERDFDRNPNRDIIRRERSCAFDLS
jgi:hypothetical protein